MLNETPAMLEEKLRMRGKQTCIKDQRQQCILYVR